MCRYISTSNTTTTTTTTASQLVKMTRRCGGVLLWLSWLSLLHLTQAAPSSGLARGYLPPPPAAPSCEVVVREVDREVEMEECTTVEEEQCQTDLTEVCEDKPTEKCDSVVEQVCTSVEAGGVLS